MGWMHIGSGACGFARGHAIHRRLDQFWRIPGLTLALCGGFDTLITSCRRLINFTHELPSSRDRLDANQFATLQRNRLED